MGWVGSRDRRQTEMKRGRVATDVLGPTHAEQFLDGSLPSGEVEAQPGPHCWEGSGTDCWPLRTQVTTLQGRGWLIEGVCVGGVLALLPWLMRLWPPPCP